MSEVSLDRDRVHICFFSVYSIVIFKLLYVRYFL